MRVQGERIPTVVRVGLALVVGGHSTRVLNTAKANLRLSALPNISRHTDCKTVLEDKRHFPTK